MINNYYTLKALADEIRVDVESSLIEACYTRVENTLEIIAAKSGSQPNVIVISCKPRANYMFLRAAPRRHSGANVLQNAVGSTILSLGVVANERTVVLGLSNQNSMVVNLFGPHANVYLLDGAGGVVDAFLRKKKLDSIPQGSTTHAAWEENAEKFVEAFKAADGSPLKRLAAVIPWFGGQLVKEAFHRTGDEEILKNAVASDTQISLLYDVVSQMIRELSQPRPRIYYDGDDPVMMSLIEMRHLGSLREAAYDSVNTCVAAYSANAERHKGDVELKDSVMDRLVKRKAELESTIGKIEKDISGNRESKYRKNGDILMEHLGDIEKGAGTYSLHEKGQEILLDPELSAVQNAQAYYEKAKKARESYKQAVARKEELEKSLETVEAELKKIETGADHNRLLLMDKTEKAKEYAQTPFREFETNGYKIYVGKDAKNNDQLTFGFAKPNDVFLHARGVSGSHVIIRNGSRDYPQKSVLEFAARIAAHYSKARTSGIVPVAYTMRKFVKKAKGKPGAVFVDREEVLFVKPGIPQPSR